MSPNEARNSRCRSAERISRRSSAVRPLLRKKSSNALWGDIEEPRNRNWQKAGLLACFKYRLPLGNWERRTAPAECGQPQPHACRDRRDGRAATVNCREMRVSPSYLLISGRIGQSRSATTTSRSCGLLPVYRRSTREPSGPSVVWACYVKLRPNSLRLALFPWSTGFLLTHRIGGEIYPPFWETSI